MKILHTCIAAACFCLALPPAILAEDWPMLGHDAGRSNWTGEEVSGPAVRKWYRSFHEEGLACGLQPVIAKGLVYVGTMHGMMHALDSETGKDAWTFRAGGGILHSAALDDGVCYFCALDGKLYAVEAESGKLLWTFATEEALWNAPLVAERKVFFGGRDGYFYAVDKKSGSPAWRTKTGGPILASCAYEGGRIYVPSEDMTAYCLAAKDGKILWTGTLYGVSCRAYYPVIAGDVVIFTTQPGLGKFGAVNALLEACRKIGMTPRRRIGADPLGPWETEEEIRAKDEHDKPFLLNPETLEKQKELVRQIHRERPHLRTFFAFDKKTGEEPWIAPICWEESCGGTGNPPIVSPDGRVIVKYAIATWARRKSYAPYLRAGYLNLSNGDVTSILDDFDPEKSPMWGMTHDEMCRLTGSGGKLVFARQGYGGYRGIKSLDLKTHEFEVLGDNIHYGEESIGPMNLLRLVKGEEIPPTMEYLTRGAGVFGGTGTYAAVSISDGVIYYIPGHEGRTQSMLVAWTKSTDGRATTWQDPRSADLRDESFRKPENIGLIRQQPLDWDMLLGPYGRCWPSDPTIITPEDQSVFKGRQEDVHGYAIYMRPDFIEKYLPEPEETLFPARVPDRIMKELEEKVGEFISGDWAPMRFPDLMFGGWYYFDDPADRFSALASAYPFLSEGLKARVRAYLKDAFQAANPFLRFRLGSGGSERTLYDLPIFTSIRIETNDRYWEPRPILIERLYPLWQWAHATGDYEVLFSQWEQIIRPLIFRVRLPEDPVQYLKMNSTISGLIAYLRLARRYGDKEAAQLSSGLVHAMLRGRIEAEKTYLYTNFLTRRPEMSVPLRYLFLTPEIGELISDHAPEESAALFERYVAHNRPTWFLAWGPLIYEYWESSIDHPMNPWSTFCARSMIFKDDGETLEKYLDIPWCKADPYYIHKLALAARAYAEGR